MQRDTSQSRESATEDAHSSKRAHNSIVIPSSGLLFRVRYATEMDQSCVGRGVPLDEPLDRALAEGCRTSSVCGEQETRLKRRSSGWRLRTLHFSSIGWAVCRRSERFDQ